MSDFESGLATKVRLLPGEQSSTSGTVSVSEGIGTDTAKCAQRGAQTVSGEAGDTSSILVTRSPLTCEDALAQDANAHDVHNAEPFTSDDVAELAEMIRPFLPSGMTLEAAVGFAVYEAQQDAERRFRRIFNGDVRYRRALVGTLAGTYDEFRAEAKS